MKKILVMILLVSVVLVSVFAEQVGTGDISVYGKIQSSAPAFSVTETGTVIDLIDNVEFQPTGAGITIGSWELKAAYQLDTGSYTLAYNVTKELTYEDGTGDTYSFKVMSNTTDADITSVGEGILNISTPTGSFTKGGSISAKLIDAIPSDAKSGNYEGVVTLTLTTN
ncbi:MAG: hypothetical protein WC990_07775 [Sphaerochaetaceae bacterium]